MAKFGKHRRASSLDVVENAVVSGHMWSEMKHWAEDLWI